MEMYRQGDVLMVAVRRIPMRAEPIPRDRGRVVLAYGEATGHAHAVLEPRVELFEDPRTGELFVRVDEPEGAALAHEEHGSITLPPGAYRVVRQREYSPRENRLVAD